jgi:hypothetical protein
MLEFDADPIATSIPFFVNGTEFLSLNREIDPRQYAEGPRGIAHAAALRLAALWRPDQTALSEPRCPLSSASRTHVGHRAASERCHLRKSPAPSTTSAVRERLSVAGSGRAFSIRPNDVGTGSNRNVPSQLTVEALGYFRET